jgi:hypothetical protein
MKVHVRYECWTYLADGRTVSAQERCESATEACNRAKEWQDFGMKANAYKVVVNLDAMEIYHIPLI